MNTNNACWVFWKWEQLAQIRRRSTSYPLHLLLSCILATKPVRGICGVSWGMGGGGGAIDTESQQRGKRKRADKKKRRPVNHRECTGDS